jgi:hypothetical protein
MSKTVWIVLCVVAVIVVAVVGLGFWGVSLYKGEVCAHLRASPAIVERLGPVQSCSWELMASGDIKDGNTFIFSLGGPKGRGRAWVRSTSDGPGGDEVFRGVALEVGGKREVIEGEDPPTR